nr:hypothetical protein LTR18_002339 [Exophiala xenobiotica]
MRIGLLEERIDGTTPADAQLVARVRQLEDQMRTMARTMQGYKELIQKYESKIEELLKIGLENADQIRALGTQNQSMMKLIKNSAKRPRILSRLSGTAERESTNLACITAPEPNASYDDIWRSFLEDGAQWKDDSDVSRFSAWCANFDAGALDSIAGSLPSRRAAHSQTDTTKGEHRQTRKR